MDSFLKNPGFASVAALYRHREDMVTPPDWAPQVRAGEQSAPQAVLRSIVLHPHRGCGAVANRTMGLMGERMLWACKGFFIGCSAEEPGGIWLDAGRNKHGEESKEHAILPKKKGDERDHSSANRPDQNTYLTWTVPDQ